jgi:hypothetical protein
MIVKKRDINKILFFKWIANIPDLIFSIIVRLRLGFSTIRKTIIGKTKPIGLKLQLLKKLPWKKLPTARVVPQKGQGLLVIILKVQRTGPLVNELLIVAVTYIREEAPTSSKTL